MGSSTIPFIDLNLIPDPTTPIIDTPIYPKVEPKLEPFDEPLQTHQFLSPIPNPRNSLTDSEATPDPISCETNNVYSEFYRISEAFKSAFAKRLQVVEDSNSQAIVPVSGAGHGNNNALGATSTAIVPKKKYGPRASELVRVTDLAISDERYFRDVVRRTRMVYDSLRVFSMVEEEKRGVGMRWMRGDLKASSLMRERELWLNRDKRIVGSIPGVYIGDLFFFRMELCVVGLHGQPQAGIDYLPASRSANGEPIATSVIVSGGYEDDEDAGDQLIYTGHGGQDKLNKQSAHQKLEGGNLALERSMHYGIEVRVIRGIKYEGGASAKVYVYDGLYKVVDSWFDIGKSGFGVYKFKLVRIDGQPDMGSTVLRYAQNLRTRPLEIRPIGYISLDISLKKENVPVFLYNDIDNDHEPLFYEYLKKTVFPPFAFNQGGTGAGCGCVLGCGDDCSCVFKNGGEFPYDQNGILLRGKPLIFECGSFCRCPPTCRNRVSQKGIRNKFEVFRSRETGWGVRALDLIQAGGFICEYVGVFLTKDQASVFTMNGDTLVYPNRFTDRWSEWGDLSQIYSDYLKPTYPSIPPLDFAIDLSRLRNVACYISHSSSPNVMVQFVLYDHNNMFFPHLMLFALENIPPLRELSLDYGVADEWTGKPLPICNE